MTWVLYLALGLAATWGLYLLYIQLASRSTEGRSAAELVAALPSLGDTRARSLVYCYTPACGPCRAMTFEVEAMQAEALPVVKLDVSQHLELARDIGIRATPTVLVIRNGRIERSIVGAKRGDYLRRLLQEPGNSRTH